MRHNTLFANHCPMDSIQGLQQSGLREPPYQNNDGEKWNPLQFVIAMFLPRIEHLTLVHLQDLNNKWTSLEAHT